MVLFCIPVPLRYIVDGRLMLANVSREIMVSLVKEIPGTDTDTDEGVLDDVVINR